MKLCVLALCFTLWYTASAQQSFTLPPLDTLYHSIDNYYHQLTKAQAEELQQQRKKRWLNYLPSPGYSPFTGGFSLSLNLAAPLAEIRLNEQAKQKLQSIERLNRLQVHQLKNEVFADYQNIERTIEEYHAKDSMVQLKQKAFALYTSQYNRNELTPSEYLNRQQDHEAFKLQRTAEANNIHRSILQLLIKAKAAIAANDDGF